jgi:hypothetical protein
MKMGAFASGRILKKTSTHQLQILLQTDQSPLYKTMKKGKEKFAVVEENSFQLNTTKKTAMNLKQWLLISFPFLSCSLPSALELQRDKSFKNILLFFTSFLPSLKYPFVHTYLKMIRAPIKNNINIILSLGLKMTFILNYKVELLKRTRETQFPLSVSIYI